MPRINSIFSLAVMVVLGVATGEAASKVLHKYHKDAMIWVSAQEMDAEELASFLALSIQRS